MNQEQELDEQDLEEEAPMEEQKPDEEEEEEEDEDEDEEEDEDEDEDEDEEKVTWTSDEKEPYIFWHVNSHGSMNDIKKQHKYEEKETDMDVRAFSIAGNQNQCGWATILHKDIPHYQHYECSGKGIDFCIPSVERIVLSNRKKKGGDIKDAYQAAITKVKELYFNTKTYYRIFESGGFEQMHKPTLYHEYQLYGNPGENTRPDSRKRLPKRASAGDKKVSDKMIYGVWVVCTNIKILEPLALTSISDDELKRLSVNKGRKNSNLYLPPELMNPLNMASRKDRMPLGASKWMKAIDELKKEGNSTDQYLRKLRIRARTVLENMWKTQMTNLHDIIDIFEPFNATGKQLNFPPIKLYSIDISCRTNIGVLKPPNPSEPLPSMHFIDSLSFDDGERMPQNNPVYGVGVGAVATGHSGSDTLSKRDNLSRAGGTKRKKPKYSRKRRTPSRTRNRFTRSRRTRH